MPSRRRFRQVDVFGGVRYAGNPVAVVLDGESLTTDSAWVPAAFELRAFFPRDAATAEDPVTGSLNASVAQSLFESGRARMPYVASQGTALGRAGRIYISRDDDGTIWVGGGTITYISGEVELRRSSSRLGRTRQIDGAAKAKTDDSHGWR
jgi:predicted PhzF superfamily epimerase YddE/YHI9